MTSNLESSRHLADPVLVVDIEKSLRELKDETPWQEKGHNAKTIVKYRDLRVVLIAMKKDAHIPQHKAEGSITIQTLEGNLRIQTPSQTIELKKGQLLALDSAMPHDVRALEETAFLLSIAAQT